MKKINLALPNQTAKYEIVIGTKILASAGESAQTYLGKNVRRLVIVSNRKVFDLYGKTVKSSLENAGFEVFVFLMGDGEKYKNFRVLENTLRFFGEKKLKRSDAVVALGGGVVGDLAGFAAAVYLRGVAFLQIPTTLLAMIDSSVGGKTAVNTEFGKNLIGAFYQPSCVLVDVETLRTLPRRELTAGFCEAVKQGTIASRRLFDQTAEFLSNYSPNNFKKHFSD
jgi:3-dehydroquinate synthase